MSNSFPLNLFTYQRKRNNPWRFSDKIVYFIRKLTKFPQALPLYSNQLYPGSKQNDRLVFAAKLTPILIFLIKTYL
jgi:hypothetical protein